MKYVLLLRKNNVCQFIEDGVQLITEAVSAIAICDNFKCLIRFLGSSKRHLELVEKLDWTISEKGFKMYESLCGNQYE